MYVQLSTIIYSLDCRLCGIHVIELAGKRQLSVFQVGGIV